jgi:hypothetical protein
VEARAGGAGPGGFRSLPAGRSPSRRISGAAQKTGSSDFRGPQGRRNPAFRRGRVYLPAISEQGLLELLLKSPNKFNECDPENSADLAQFQQVQPPCSRLIVADECLRLAELVGHVRLTETGLPPELAE